MVALTSERGGGRGRRRGPRAGVEGRRKREEGQAISTYIFLFGMWTLANDEMKTQKRAAANQPLSA